MKKFYMNVSTTLLLACLLLISISELKAQEICPTNPKVFRAKGYSIIGQPVHFIYIEGFYPNANITLFTGSTPLPIGGPYVTGPDSSGRAIYDSTLFAPDFVSTCSTPGCCRVPIPDPTRKGLCDSSVVYNIIYPATATTPQICCIYLSNSVASGSVRLFDGFQNLIPTASSTYAFTDLDGFVCYVYDCSKLPTSITVCGANGCCSKQVGQQASLPIKLTGFTAKLTTDNKVVLNWISNLEIGSDKYIVERSLDGRTFTEVGQIKSAGNTTSSRTYSYTDAGFNSIAYYRLKMVDIDGNAEYSKVVYVNLRGGAGVVTQVFPNPFKSDIQLIGISASDLNSKNVRVFSATGQQVNFKIVGSNAIAIDEHAPRGMYILSVKDQRFKLIKE